MAGSSRPTINSSALLCVTWSQCSRRALHDILDILLENETAP